MKIGNIKGAILKMEGKEKGHHKMLLLFTTVLRDKWYRIHATAWGAKIFTARDLHRAGLGPALAAVPEGGDAILSIDVDGIDPAVVPGVILPAFGGLGYRQMLDLIEGVAARARIVGACFVEYVPEQDPQGSGAQAIARLACNLIAAIGGQRAGP